MIVHLNGQLIPARDAHISPFDRGFVFGDGVYEGLRSFRVDGRRRVVGMDMHIERLAASLDETRIPFDAETIGPMTDALLDANQLDEAFVYWQVTRGAPGDEGPRRPRAPHEPMAPTVFGYVERAPPLSAFSAPKTKSMITLEDTRWRLGHIKSTSLMASAMMAIEAHGRGADDALLVRDGLVSEATTSNVFVVTRDGSLVTPRLDDPPILAGVTRRLLLMLAPDARETRVPSHLLREAREVILAGTSTMVLSVVSLDGGPVGSGAPGPVAGRLLDALVEHIGKGAV